MVFQMFRHVEFSILPHFRLKNSIVSLNHHKTWMLLQFGSFLMRILTASCQISDSSQIQMHLNNFTVLFGGVFFKLITSFMDL